VRRLAVGKLFRHVGVAAGTPRAVDREVDHDPVHPGGEAREARVERRGVAPDPDEGFLCNVVGLAAERTTVSATRMARPMCRAMRRRNAAWSPEATRAMSSSSLPSSAMPPGNRHRPRPVHDDTPPGEKPFAAIVDESASLPGHDAIPHRPDRTLAHRRAFTISRGAKTEAQVVVAELSDGTYAGRGECVPYARYGETIEGVAAAIEAMHGRLTDRHALQATMPAGAARNALDCAFWDFEAKASGRPVHALAGLPAPEPLVTAYTISLGAPSDGRGRREGGIAQAAQGETRREGDGARIRACARRRRMPN